jgi:hypothetical protein
MIKKFASVLAVGAASALLLTGSAFAATHAKTIAACSAKGRHAHCVAGANVFRPVGLTMHISAQPRQKVVGAWSIRCSKGARHSMKTVAFIGNARPTLTRSIALTYRHPDSCIVAADGLLSRTGRIRVWVTAVR